MNHACLELVATAYRTGAENLRQDGIVVTRIRGGGNNAMYRACTDGEDFAIKLCVKDERQRAEREYSALKLFARIGFNFAPKPVLLDDSCSLFPHPIVVYHWVEGEPILDSVSQEQLTALLSLLQQTHSIHPTDIHAMNLFDAQYHHFDFLWYLDELQELFSKYAEWLGARPGDRELHERLKHLVDGCIEFVSHVFVSPDRDQIALSFCHVDANLANFIWNSHHELFWLDWEYSGWGDPAIELAEFESHLGAEGLTSSQRAWFRANYCRPQTDCGFDDRLAVWDRILFTRWPLLIARNLWSAYHGPDRVRLTALNDSPGDIRRRLVKSIERAERFASN